MREPHCGNCNDEGWVCENHMNVPWGEGDGCCGGAGSPCPNCNPCDRDHPPRPLRGSRVVFDKDGWRH